MHKVAESTDLNPNVIDHEPRPGFYRVYDVARQGEVTTVPNGRGLRLKDIVAEMIRDNNESEDGFEDDGPAVYQFYRDGRKVAELAFDAKPTVTVTTTGKTIRRGHKVTLFKRDRAEAPVMVPRGTITSGPAVDPEYGHDPTLFQCLLRTDAEAYLQSDRCVQALEDTGPRVALEQKPGIGSKTPGKQAGQVAMDCCYEYVKTECISPLMRRVRAEIEAEQPGFGPVASEKLGV